MAIPEAGFLVLEEGRYGPIFPRTPACYGFSVIGKVKEGREQAIRDYGKEIEAAVAADPKVLAPLQLHYLRWVLFDVGGGTHFQYQGIFDTDFDKYIEDAVEIFNSSGITTVFTNLEGFPDDWRTNITAVNDFFRDASLPELPRIRGVPLRHGGRGQKGTSAESRVLRHAGPDAVIAAGVIADA